MFNSKTRILVIDDSAIMRKIVIKYLNAMQLTNWVEARDGKEALKIIKKEKIGLILSDWNMPRLCGIDLLRAVRADKRTNKIPFIMISAEGQRHQLAEAVEEGVSAYIIKPFSNEVLSRGISKAFKESTLHIEDIVG